MILGGATLGALLAYPIDLKVKSFAQTKGLLPKNVSHFGDEYGGRWAHWVLWSSILATSWANKDHGRNVYRKMEYSTAAMVTNGIITHLMKVSFGRVRPNGGCCKSFPSGHTSHSFTVAAIAHELFGDAVGTIAYLTAALVAVSRINDNKHYLSDVVLGAGLGTVIGRGFSSQYNKGVSIIQPSAKLSLRIALPL
ncbi:MAG: phosphatase PAP2 family protein [Candidatus Marinimicrobia bacterium]|nr:phosphatase PAP2 family protein [Candidatus Neomarinimicrobiota bacterium]